MGRYVDLTTIRDYLGFGTGNTATDGLLDDCINRAEAAIDNYTRRSFGTTQGTVTYSQRTANIQGQALYLTRDLYGVVGGTIWNGAAQAIPMGSVFLEPTNEGPPYRVVRLYVSFVWTWNTDGTIAIPGAWGFSIAAPYDIQQATVRYAAWLYRQKDIGGVPEVSGFIDAGEVQFPRGIPDDVRYLLSPYRSRSGGVV